MKYHQVPLTEIFGIHPKFDKDEEVGIEVEVEGENLVRNFLSHWSYHADNSLRGESAEYVLRKPVQRKDVPKVLRYLSKQLNENHSLIVPSNRTSVHVHLNMLQLTMKKIYNIMCMYVIFEDMLVEYCGKERIGNLFCLRSSDAEYLLHVLRDAAKADRYNGFGRDELRYSSMNVCALTKYGSLEFRSLRCPAKDNKLDTDTIQEWVDILTRLKDVALGYDSPDKIVRDFSLKGPVVFAKQVLGDLYKRFNTKDFEARLYKNVRLIQDVAFATEWEPDAEVTKKIKPQKPDERKKKGVRAGQINMVGGGGGGGRFVLDVPQWAINPQPAHQPEEVPIEDRPFDEPRNLNAREILEREVEFLAMKAPWRALPLGEERKRAKQQWYAEAYNRVRLKYNLAANGAAQLPDREKVYKRWTEETPNWEHYLRLVNPIPHETRFRGWTLEEWSYDIQDGKYHITAYKFRDMNDEEEFV